MTERSRGGQESFWNQSRESLTSGKGVRGRSLRRQEAQSIGVEHFESVMGERGGRGR
jgi:hypothetical protein